jgi:hypothetical protein
VWEVALDFSATLFSGDRSFASISGMAGCKLIRLEGGSRLDEETLLDRLNHIITRYMMIREKAMPKTRSIAILALLERPPFFIGC